MPGAVAAMRRVQALQLEIDLTEVQQQQAQARVDIDLQTAEARSNLIQSLVNLDAMAENLRKTFHP